MKNIDEYQEKYDFLFEVEKVQIEEYDDGDLIDVNDWYSAVNRLTPEQRYPCKDEETAKELCKFLNSIPDLGSPVIDNLSEWSSRITELSVDEIALDNLKEKIFNKEQEIIKNTDFNKLYGANNKDVRKAHLDKEMLEDYERKKDLEFSIDYNKRRISFLKQLIHTKTVLMEVKG